MKLNIFGIYGNAVYSQAREGTKIDRRE